MAWRTCSISAASSREGPVAAAAHVVVGRAAASLSCPAAPASPSAAACHEKGISPAPPWFNCALEVGVTFKALLSAQGDVIFTSSALSAIDVDVLIAPDGWEVEPTRELIERVLAQNVLPKYAEVLSSLPIPSVDLTELNLEGINALKISDVSLTTAGSGLSISADLALE